MPKPSWRPDGLAIKPYTIARDGADAPSLALIGTARRIAETEIPKAAAYDTGHHGLGFAILHEGEEAIWLLLHWWAHGDICCRALFRADSGTLEFEDVSKRSLMACVWELRVIDHERVYRKPGPVSFEVAAIYTIAGGKIARIDFVK